MKTLTLYRLVRGVWLPLRVVSASEIRELVAFAMIDGIAIRLGARNGS